MTASWCTLSVSTLCFFFFTFILWFNTYFLTVQSYIILEKYLENTLFIGKPILHFDTIESTNDYAKLLLTNNTPKDGTVILADFQSKGRGQQRNTWHSQKGENLLFSIILYPKFLKLENQFYINMAICNGIIHGINAISVVPSLKVKWPNDIMVGDKKLSGILIESALMGAEIKYIIVGIGVNMRQKHWENMDTAISLINLFNLENLSHWDLLESILIGIEQNYFKLRKGDFSDIKENYLEYLYRYDDKYHYFEWGDMRKKAKISDILQDGRIRLVEQHDNSIHDFAFKQIKFC